MTKPPARTDIVQKLHGLREALTKARRACAQSVDPIDRARVGHEIDGALEALSAIEAVDGCLESSLVAVAVDRIQRANAESLAGLSDSYDRYVLDVGDFPHVAAVERGAAAERAALRQPELQQASEWGVSFRPTRRQPVPVLRASEARGAYSHHARQEIPVVVETGAPPHEDQRPTRPYKPALKLVPLFVALAIGSSAPACATDSDPTPPPATQSTNGGP